MSDAMSTEQLQPGQNQAEIGAPPQAEHAGGQAGLPVLGTGSAAGAAATSEGK